MIGVVNIETVDIVHLEGIRHDNRIDPEAALLYLVCSH